jgi:hypothetical protein
MRIREHAVGLGYPNIAPSSVYALSSPATGGQPPAGSTADNPGAPAPTAKSTHKHKQVKQAPAATGTRE